LRKVPRKPLPRWYQTTPAPHRACPLCGGFVISTVNNSPWLFAPFVFLGALFILGLYWPATAAFTNSLLGRLLMLLVVSPLLWLAIKNSKLVCEPPSVLTHHSSGTPNGAL